MSSDQKLSVFDRVTQKIITDLENGVLPWQKPWNGGDGIDHITRPLRHTGEPYNGVNILLLWDEAATKGFCNPTWMTFKQAEEYGGKVKKGEKAAFVVYANKLTKTETDEATGADVERQIPFLRGYHVFNVEQIEGLPEKFALPAKPAIQTTVGRLERVEYFIRNTGAEIRHGGDSAHYSEILDQIHLPSIDAFKDRESYYATLAHEATHWTKHETRLNRDFGRVKWGDEGYAKEELVAEIGSAFLCADLGITPETREDHAAYIGNWLKILKNDRKFIFSAAAHATRAVEYLKGLQPPNNALDANAEVAGLVDYKTLHVSEPMQIGNHQWRLLIERQGRGKCTRYERQKPDETFWRRSQEWPSHNINDTYLGLPRGLAKLYDREMPVLIQHGLVSLQNQPQQGELAI
jgi:antirestriction protein ArdC